MSPLTSEQAEKLCKWRGFSSEIVTSISDKKLVGIYRGNIAFAVDGGYHYRKKDGSWRYSEGAKASLFVLGEVQEGAPVHCFESQWCAIAYADASGDRDNIVASRGAGNAKLIADKLKGHTGPIYLWQQQDKAGEKWAQDIRALLPDEQLKLVAIPAKDLNEWRKKGATDNDVFKAMLDAKDLASNGICSLSQALDASVAFLCKYMRFEGEWEADVCALWCAATWVFTAFRFTPYLYVHSPETSCGKSTLFDCLKLLVREPWSNVSVSEAALYNKASESKPTMFVDEVDAVYGDEKKNEPLRALLNGGFKKGEKVARCPMGRLTEYEVYCPKALAGIGRLPDTISNRSIHIPLSRQSRDNRAERMRDEQSIAETKPIRDFYEAWARQSFQAIADARPHLPEELDGRQMDICEILLAIAGLASPEWKERGEAAILLSFDRSEDTSNRVKLLSSLRSIFMTKGQDKLPSTEIIESLVKMEDADAPWPAWWANDVRLGNTQKPLQKVAAMLKDYRIKPHQIRIGDTVCRGYIREDFEAAWKAYVPTEAKAVTLELGLTI